MDLRETLHQMAHGNAEIIIEATEKRGTLEYLPEFLKTILSVLQKSKGKENFIENFKAEKRQNPFVDEFMQKPAGVALENDEAVYTFATKISKVIPEFSDETRVNVTPSGLTIGAYKIFIPGSGVSIKDQTECRRIVLKALEHSGRKSEVARNIRKNLDALVDEIMDIVDIIKVSKEDTIKYNSLNKEIMEAKEKMNSVRVKCFHAINDVLATQSVKKRIIIEVLKTKFNRILNWDNERITLDDVTYESHSVTEISDNIKAPFFMVPKITMRILTDPESEVEKVASGSIWGLCYRIILNAEKVLNNLPRERMRYEQLENEWEAMRKSRLISEYELTEKFDMSSVDNELDRIKDSAKELKNYFDRIDEFSVWTIGSILGYYVYSYDGDANTNAKIPHIKIPGSALGIYSEEE